MQNTARGTAFLELEPKAARPRVLTEKRRPEGCDLLKDQQTMLKTGPRAVFCSETNKRCLKPIIPCRFNVKKKTGYVMACHHNIENIDIT